MTAVHDRDDDDPGDIIDEGERQQIGAHPVGDVPAYQGQAPRAKAVSVDIAAPQPAADAGRR